MPNPAVKGDAAKARAPHFYVKSCERKGEYHERIANPEDRYS